MTRPRQHGYAHVLILLLTVIGTFVYFGLPYYLSLKCNGTASSSGSGQTGQAPIAVVIRSGGSYCLWQISKGTLEPLAELIAPGRVGSQRCNNDSGALQREADNFNANPSSDGDGDAGSGATCVTPAVLEVIPYAYNFWSQLFRGER